MKNVFLILAIVLILIIFFMGFLIRNKYEFFNNNLEIPKIIHQTWKDEFLPDKYKTWSEQIKKSHPDWEYNLWTDTENYNFIKDNYPWFLKTYNSYDKNIKRVDAIRYFFLYHYGGVYMDMDIITLKNIDPLMEKGKCIFGYQLKNKDDKGSIPNAFMACPPKHPFFKKLISELSKSKHLHVLKATGPEYLTEKIRKAKFKNIIVHEMPIIYTHEWNKKNKHLELCENDFEFCKKTFPNSYTTTFWSGSWLGKPLEYTIPKFITKKIEIKDSLVPKNLFKILITDEKNNGKVPDYTFDCVKSWIKLNPEYDFYFLTGKDCETFILNYFGERVLNAYKTLKPYAYKCDLARVCLLYVFGGVYSDLRMTLLKPLKEILDKDCFFTIPNDRTKGFNSSDTPLVNGFICSTPNNPILKNIIEEICVNVENRYYGKCTLDITGPSLIGEICKKILGTSGYFKEGVYLSNLGKYRISHFTGEFIEKEGENIILVKNKNDEFDKDIKNENVYWKMWKNKDIYVNDSSNFS